MTLNERALAFGESGSLFGILGSPDVPDPQRPAVLIPNTGVIHRVGPSRMHVELARALAAAGVVSLRLDNANLGDSETVPGRSSDTSALDLCAAMDALDAGSPVARDRGGLPAVGETDEGTGDRGAVVSRRQRRWSTQHGCRIKSGMTTLHAASRPACFFSKCRNNSIANPCSSPSAIEWA